MFGISTVKRLTPVMSKSFNITGGHYHKIVDDTNHNKLMEENKFDVGNKSIQIQTIKSEVNDVSFICDAKGIVYKQDVKMLLDSGATHNFLNKNHDIYKFCLQNHVKSRKVNINARMANTNITKITTELLNIPIILLVDEDHYIETHIDAYVSPLNQEDFIIGREFIRKYMKIEFKNDLLVKKSPKQVNVNYYDNKQNDCECQSFKDEYECKYEHHVDDSSKQVQVKYIQDDEIEYHSDLLEPQIESDDEDDYFTPIKTNGIENVKVGTGDNYNKNKRIELGKQLLQENQDLFPVELPSGLPPSRRFDMEIKFKNENITPLIKKSNIIYSIKELELLKGELDKYLSKGWIRESQSPISSPCFYVNKKNVTEKRLCIDYRLINNHTIKQDHGLPRIKEILSVVKNAKIWSSLDLKSGYYQVRIKDDDSYKTSFNCHFGQFEWLVVPFGLSNAPSVFQQTMNYILQPVLGVCCIVYIDDIIIYSNDVDSHYNHVNKVLQLLRENHFYLNAKKCNIYSTSISLLGFDIDDKGTNMQPDKLEVILNYPPPKTITELRAFNGMVAFYKCFVDGYSHIMVPLTDATKTTIKVNGKSIKKKYELTNEVLNAFNQIKTAIRNAPSLYHINYNKNFIIETDASDFAIGSALMQENDNHQRHPIEYYGRKLSLSERNYPTFDKELLSIVESLNHYRHIIDGQKVIIYTDHQAITNFLSMGSLKNQRQARWSMILSMYNIDENSIKHQAGKNNKLADFISRRPDWKELNNNKLIELQDRSELQDESNIIKNQQVIINATTAKVKLGDLINKVKQAQQQDELCNIIKNNLYYETNQSLKLHLIGDYLYRGELIYVPNQQLRSEIITNAHDGLDGGHAGIGKCIEIISEFYWWKSYRNDIIDYISSCLICQKSKTSRHSDYGLLNIIEPDNEPFSDISIDFIGPLPVTANGLNSIICVIDRTTRYGIFIANRTTDSATDIIKALNRFVFAYFGLPLNITSDRDTRFNNELYQAYSKYWGIKLSMTSSYHPKGDGLVEKLNQNLINYLTCYVNDNRSNWNDLLSNASVAYNCKTHSSTGYAPQFLLLGYRMRNPFRIKSTFKPTQVKSLDEHLKLQQQAHELALLKLKQANDKMKSNYDKYRRDIHYKVGDLVYLSREHLRSSGNQKLMKHFIGPFEILEIIKEGSAVRIKLPPNYSSIHNVINVERLKPAKEVDAERFPTQTITNKSDPILVEGEIQYEIEKIINKRGNYYKVRWLNWSDEYDQWIHKDNLTNAQRLVRGYEESLQVIRLCKSTIKEKSKSTITSGTSDRIYVTVRCQGTNKLGLQCRRKTRRGTACYYHAQKQFNYRIKQSCISGLGLFSGDRGYYKGETICIYSGKIIQYDDEHQGGDYAIHYNRNHYVDGCESTSIGSFANDCRVINKRNKQCLGNNAKYFIDYRNKQIALKATRDIPPSTEILCPYGAEYWRDQAKHYANKQLVNHKSTTKGIKVIGIESDD
jgi:RNase H-like domain found in reverse transcriptase/Reverse transcriptase (RNA-dependent DNA polymerase)/Integrase zinc binding domain